MTTSSIRSCMVVLVCVGFATACKKREEPTRAPEPSVEARSTPAAVRAAKPQVAPATGAALATKYIECIAYINAADWNAMRDKCFAAGYVAHPVDDQDITGPAAMLGFLQDMKTALPDLTLEPQLVLVNGHNILAVVLRRGTHRGTLKTPMGDVAATNKRVGELYFSRLVLNDDMKAEEHWMFTNPVAQMGQLGLMPKLPSRKAVEKGIIDRAPMIVVAADDEKERTNLATVTKWNELFSAHKVPELMALYADNALESDQAEAKDWNGKQEIQRETKQFFSAFPDVRLDINNLFAAGDYVVSIGRFTGTNTGDLPGMKKTGKHVTVSYAEVIKVENGKLVEVRRFRSGLAMAKQLGMMPPIAPKPTQPQAEPKSKGY